MSNYLCPREIRGDAEVFEGRQKFERELLRTMEEERR